MDREKLLAAETFAYSYVNYDDSKDLRKTTKFDDDHLMQSLRDTTGE